MTKSFLNEKFIFKKIPIIFLVLSIVVILKFVISYFLLKRVNQNPLIYSLLLSLIFDFILLTLLFLLFQYFFKKIKECKISLHNSIAKNHYKIYKKEAKLNAFYDNFLIYYIDINGVITFVNENLCDASNCNEEELVGKNHRILFHKEIDSAVFKEMWDKVLKGESWVEILKLQSESQKSHFTEVRVTPIFDKNSGLFTQFLVILNCVTDFIQQKGYIRTILQYDKLTKLSNRSKLIRDILNAKNPKLALLNVDKFKEINDFYGYKCGDKLLLQIANLLRDLTKYSKISIYRLYSDEFALFQDSSNSFDTFIDFISSIIGELEKHKFIVYSQEITINITAGISKSKYDTLSTADMALNRAKLKRESIGIYNSLMNFEEEIQKNIEGVKVVKDAIKNGNIIPYFQPILNLKENRIDKYETLARLVDSNSISLPNSFIYYAQRAKLYPYITKMIIEKSFNYFTSLDRSDIGFSINISLQDIKNREVVNLIIEKLKSFKNPDRVTFEILESEGLKNYDEVIKFIEIIKFYGAKIAIDDFGSGYSNFIHLIKLNIDYLKIDSSLIKDIKNDRTAKILIESIVYFSKKLGIETIAEYIEDEESFEELKRVGVDFLQGYYIGKPSEKILI